ncbi:MAG: ATP-dependent zinc metalloprotease FtsH [Candidatus Firestonebacteria bacterium]
MNGIFKSMLFWVLIIVSVALALNVFYTGKKNPVELSYDEFMSSVDRGEVVSVIISEAQNKAEGRLKDGRTFFSNIGSDPELWKALKAAKSKVNIKPADQFSWASLIISLLPFVLLFVLGYIFIKQMQGAGNSAFSFTQNKAKLFSSNQLKVTFADVAGCNEAKEELKEVIEFLKNPTKFTKLGGKIPKGVLLLGAPGVGKTLLSRAVAGEAAVPFFSISGSEFVELFVGVGASRVRALFDQAKKNAPCIVFIDELDAVGRHRGAGMGGGHDEREQTLNQLLVEMDGFDTNSGVIMVAATNRPDVLDPALLRPGRFDRRVVVDVPDLNGRAEILKIHSKKVPLAKDIDLEVIARGTPGFTGADLANLVNEAALLAARKDQKEINAHNFEEAKDKIIMGLEKRSRIISDKEKKIVAYHEAGHALVGKLTPGAEPLHKVTIIPRGRALGVTWQLPIEDKYLRAKNEFLTNIKILLAGRITEEIFFDDVTTGASNDFSVATQTAHAMVCEYGMSKKLGTRTYGRADREVFLGRDFMREKDYSEDTAKAIDREVASIINTSYAETKRLIVKHKDKLVKLANELLDKESLNGEQVDELLGIKQKEKQEKKAGAKPATPPAPEVKTV